MVMMMVVMMMMMMMMVVVVVVSCSTIGTLMQHALLQVRSQYKPDQPHALGRVTTTKL